MNAQNQAVAEAAATVVAMSDAEELAVLRVRCREQQEQIRDLENADGNGSVMQRKLLLAAEDHIKALEAQLEELREERRDLLPAARHLAGLLGTEIAIVMKANEAGIEGNTAGEIVETLMARLEELKKLNGIMPRQLNQLMRRREQNIELGRRIQEAAHHVLRNHANELPAPTMDVAAVVGIACMFVYCPIAGSYTEGMSRDMIFGMLKRAVAQLTGITPDGAPRTYDDIEVLLGDSINSLIETETKIKDWARLYTMLRNQENWGDNTVFTTSDWSELGKLTGQDFDEFVRAKMVMAAALDT